MKQLHISDLEDKLSLINGDMPVFFEFESGERVPLTKEYLITDGIYVHHTINGRAIQRSLIIKVPKEPINEPR